MPRIPAPLVHVSACLAHARAHYQPAHRWIQLKRHDKTDPAAAADRARLQLHHVLDLERLAENYGVRGYATPQAEHSVPHMSEWGAGGNESVTYTHGMGELMGERGLWDRHGPRVCVV
eukprot:COSAG05_NODE_7451_length_809_cov_2.347887_1_plen_118_part_00